jgi:hypothetical protein
MASKRESFIYHAWWGALPSAWGRGQISAVRGAEEGAYFTEEVCNGGRTVA